MSPVLLLHPDDHLVVALRDLRAGQEVSLPDGTAITIREDIPAKHKFSRTDLGDGAQVRMYDTVVGRVRGILGAGGRVTTDNLRHATDDYQLDHHVAPTGRPRTSATSAIGGGWATPGRMAGPARLTTGSSSPSYSAKTRTSPPSSGRSPSNWASRREKRRNWTSRP
ncbi:UxaA family hydrolase [Lewinella sp. W8]|uniref:UxaA family hydrolase n=1 Tax=Lewinella sp. W8 TaxID=2528208 RepID=UPI0034CDF079